MSEKLFTTIKTNQGNVKIPQDDRELQKVVSLIYSMDQEIDQLKAQILKMRSWKNCTHEVDSDGCEQAGNLDGPCDIWEMMK